MNYEFTDRFGSFRMTKPERSSYLYFPLAGDSGMKSCVTPLLGGDSKLDQNTFFLPPVSAEDLHNQRACRNFWCVLDGRSVWSAVGVSAEAELLRDTPLEEQTVLEAGLMWHQITRTSPKYNVRAKVTSFVPCDEVPMEVLSVSVCNTGAQSLTVQPIAAIPVYARSADNVRDHRHVTSLLHRMAVVNGGVEVTPTMTFDERGHKENTKTYFVYGLDAQGRTSREACCTVAEFLGEGGSYTRPESVYACTQVWQGVGAERAGGEAMGALRFAPVTLQPGQSHSWCVLMGIAEREAREKMRASVLARYATAQDVERALARVKQTWQERVNVHFETADPVWDSYMYWVTFQPILRRIFGCSFLPYHDYGKGGRGWRDLWQDCLALLLMEPQSVRQKLIDYYGGVRMDGTNATIIGRVQGEFVADRNSITRVWMDHGFWPLQTTLLYIHQTGDTQILLEQSSYFKDARIFRSERRDETWSEAYGLKQRDSDGNILYGTLLEHILLQNVTAAYDVGEHGHLRLRDADWNDGMDMAFARGESVTFTAAYAGNLHELSVLLRHMAQTTPAVQLHANLLPLLQYDAAVFGATAQKRARLQAFHEACVSGIPAQTQAVSTQALAETLEKMSAWMQAHIRRQEWRETSMGGFYNGYYDDHACALEGQFPGGVRMGLTSQVFPIMFDTATDAQVAEIIASSDRLLYRADIGGYRLNTDFGQIKLDMGRAYGFAYGHKENGSVFSHMAVMYANALYRRGFVEAGFRAIDALYRQSMDFPHSRIYPGLPEYFSESGRGMYAYLTGSASWLLMTVVTQMFGLTGEYGDLVIRPKLVDSQFAGGEELAVELYFAGVKLKVRYVRTEPQRVYTRVRALWLDGKRIDGERITRSALTDDGAMEHTISVEV